MIFVDVILPLALPKTYSYAVPLDLQGGIKVGVRVMVQFGPKRKYSAVVSAVGDKAPIGYQPKFVEEVLDELPIVNDFQFKFWNWISSYYMCTLGEVYVAAFPSGLKLNSFTNVVLNEQTEYNENELTDREFLIVEALKSQQVLTLGDVSEIVELKNGYTILKPLVEKGIIAFQEDVVTKYKPKLVAYVELINEKEEWLKEQMDVLAKAPKQLGVLMKYLQLSNHFGKVRKPVKKLELQNEADVTSSTVKELEKKGIISVFEVQESRLLRGDDEVEDSSDLSEYQVDKLQEIKSNFDEHDVVLLHGVTSSGKTEIYIKLIEEAIAKGKQTLYLLPEIALTTQIIERLKKNFGEQVGVFHSKYGEHEKVELWNEVLNNGDIKVLIGARSSIFLPFSKLDLVIVDEEHDNSFKQYDPSPRYNARDASIVLAKLHGAKVLMGSATPSIESYNNVKQEKYGLVEMTKRFGNVQMPEIFVADLKDDYKKKKNKGIFSDLLYRSISEVVENKEQVILFQNRRGFSPFVQCTTCSWIPDCKNCDVSLTYHKIKNRYICHYCGYTVFTVKNCVACGSTEIKERGFGTEKIEDEIKELFPSYKVARLDLDTTRAKYAYQKIIGDFENQQTDILIGTQMITKGLDFSNVALVGVLNADMMLHFSDFRAFERSYQLMAQVSGRAGRKKKRGKVVIQSFEPYHPIIRDVIDNNYHNMYKNEVVDRRSFQYPPFYRLIQFTLKHKKVEQLNETASHFAALLRQQFGKRILGPEFPPVARVRGSYQKNILFKLEKEANLGKAKAILSQLLNQMATEAGHKSVRVIVDVDPN